MSQSTSKKPLVAICMATYNPPIDLFKKQISSIVNQTYDNWICIINDDCSEKDIFSKIQNIVSKDELFITKRNPARLGFYYNFEK